MKQKVADNSPVTKAELNTILKKELTQSESRIIRNFNKELSERLTASQNAFRIEIQHEFMMMREELDARLSVFIDRILTAIDPLLKELETRQQDREIATAKINYIEKDVENLNKRVTKLEHS